MGVNGLWQILSSVRQRCSLEELRGKRLAVDLSGWVCVLCQTKALAAAVHKPYLRNLFYRLLHLYTECGVRLLFVVDGPAAPIKWATMDRRMGVGGREGGGRRTGVRHNLNSKVKEVLTSSLPFTITHTPFIVCVSAVSCWRQLVSLT